jgi:hypothetical protein
MQESCTYGSVRGAPSNGCPYRNRDSVRAGIDVANSQAQAFGEVDADLGNRGYRRDSH